MSNGFSPLQGGERPQQHRESVGICHWNTLEFKAGYTCMANLFFFQENKANLFVLIYWVKFLESTRTEPAACRKYLKRNSCHFTVERSGRDHENGKVHWQRGKWKLGSNHQLRISFGKNKHSNKHAHKMHPKAHRMHIVTEINLECYQN